MLREDVIDMDKLRQLAFYGLYLDLNQIGIIQFHKNYFELHYSS